MGLLDAFGFDKKKMVASTIETCLENVAEELGVKPTELFIMIKPVKNEFSEEYDAEDPNFKNWIYKLVNGVPTKVREISLKEILGEDDE